MRYNIAIETEENSVLIPWGETKGWIKEYEKLLNNATVLTLIPKEGENIPVVTVTLTGKKRWVLFSRVYGKINKDTREKKEIRMYCVGWQCTISGKNIKSLNWVYPSGAVENADSPSYVDKLL